MHIEYKVERRDYLSAARGGVKEPWSGRWLRRSGLAAFAVGPLLLYECDQFPRWLAPLALMALGLAVLVVPTLSAYARSDRAWKDSERLSQPIVLDASETGLRMTTSIHQFGCAWTFFHHFLETRDLIILYVTQTRMGQIIPKRAFASAQAIDEFRELLRAHVVPPRSAFPVVHTNGN